MGNAGGTGSGREEFHGGRSLLWPIARSQSLNDPIAISFVCELQAEKVLFLSELRAEPNAQQRAVQMAQFGGNAREAETALVKSGRFFRAILLNLGIFRFDRCRLLESLKIFVSLISKSSGLGIEVGHTFGHCARLSPALPGIVGPQGK